MFPTLAQLSAMPWALSPEWMQALATAVSSIDAAGRFEHQVASRFGRADRGPAAASGVAVVPVRGIITQRADLWSELFGGGNVSAEALGDTIKQLGADKRISAIVLDIDSPGGSVGGLSELGNALYDLRDMKPVAAVANSLAASAAYWIGSAASEFNVAPEAQVGSIGVWTMHVDSSEMLRMMGLTPTLISAGRYKVEGNAYGPLDTEARMHLQSQVDEYYGMFVRDVGRNRNATQAAVRNGYGQGRTLTASRAVDAGLADRIATLDETIHRVQSQGTRNTRLRAELDAMETSFTAPRSIHSLRAELRELE